MSFRSLAKVFNNAKIFVNTQSTVSQQLINSDTNENNEYKQIAENHTPSLKKMNSDRRKKRQRLHFRPIIPEHYLCPITQELMTDPVIVSSGHTFERTAIIEWFAGGNTINPLTGQPLQHIDIKPNYALKDAIKEYRRKLADELFRITFDEDKNEEILCYRDNILFHKDDKPPHKNKNNNNNNDINNEYDGYISDDEQEDNISTDDSNSNLKNKKKRKKKYKNKYSRNIPIIAFLGPNNTGKSTLLNLIVGEPVFVTIDELSDYDILSKLVRFKIVTRADREFILLDVEGLFPFKNVENIDINDAVLKIFFAVYSIASVIVWNDINENNPYLKKLLQKADMMMQDINCDGDYYFRPSSVTDLNDFQHTPNGGLLPHELREFLLKKYQKLSKKQEMDKTYTHKPAFIILKRDFKPEFSTNNDIKNINLSPVQIPPNRNNKNNNNNNNNLSPWLSSDTEHKMKLNSSPSLFSLSSAQHVPPFITEITDSPSADLSPSPWPQSQSQSHERFKNRKINYQILSKNNNISTCTCTSSGNDLSIVNEEISDSSVLMDNILNHSIIYGNKHHKKHKSNSILFSNYLAKHDDFNWLRQLNLFSFVDGVVLHKLDEESASLLSILPKLDAWINEWCQRTLNVIPIVRNNTDMLLVIKMLNKCCQLSCIKYVEECLLFKGSRLQKYFYYVRKEKTIDELKLIAERFKWDNKNLMDWFIKHFNRLWYQTKDFPNSHYALVYQTLFCESYTSTDILAQIILNLSHFYYQISNKVDLYRDIVDKTAEWGQFAGAVSGLGSLSLMSVIHPLVGIAAVPFSIHFASRLGNKSGAKVGNAIAYSKAHFLDGNERYDLGEINSDVQIDQK